ncbi:MAG TPA: hypothetical protein VFR59_09105, partial [Steroidobacteraceae bacterium]|nr:hypothetical protein [Steroidobacteraceae bacterium]
MEDQIESMRQIKTTLLDLAVRFGPKMLAALVILTIGVFVSRWAGRWADRGLAHLELEPPVR